MADLCVELLLHRVAERDAGSVLLYQRGQVVGEDGQVLEQQLSVFLLPLVTVGLDVGAVGLMGVEVRHLVEEHQQEVVGVQVAVDADGMVVAARMWPTVVAQFGSTLAGDVQEDAVPVKKIVHRVDGIRWQVFG